MSSEGLTGPHSRPEGSQAHPEGLTAASKLLSTSPPGPRSQGPQQHHRSSPPSRPYLSPIAATGTLAVHFELLPRPLALSLHLTPGLARLTISEVFKLPRRRIDSYQHSITLGVALMTQSSLANAAPATCKLLFGHSLKLCKCESAKWVEWAAARKVASEHPSLLDGSVLAGFQRKLQICRRNQCKCACNCHSGSECAIDSDARFHFRSRAARNWD